MRRGDGMLLVVYNVSFWAIEDTYGGTCHALIMGLGPRLPGPSGINDRIASRFHGRRVRVPLDRHRRQRDSARDCPRRHGH